MRKQQMATPNTLIDDSASMENKKGRIEQLREIGRRLALIGGLCDDNGYQMRAFTTDLSGVRREGGSKPVQDNCKNHNDFDSLFGNIRFTYPIPMGAQTKAKIHTPLFLDKIKANTFDKPVSVWYITDGEPCPEGEDVMFNTCADTYKKLRASAAY